MAEAEDLCARFARDLRVEFGGRARIVADAQRVAASGDAAAAWARVIDELDALERRAPAGRKLSLFRQSADRP